MGGCFPVIPKSAAAPIQRSDIPLSPNPASSTQARSSSSFRSPTKYTVFISHAGEDKSTIAIPLRDMLMKRGITAFVDETDMSAGTEAKKAMISAMESADIAVVVLSPEFIAREWPMKELMCFLRRREESSQDSECRPVIIPFFYRLSISELYKEPRLTRMDSHGNSLYLKSRFLERMSAGEPEADVEKVKAALQKLRGIMGVENDVDASNGSAHVMYRRRDILLRELSDKIQKSVWTETMSITTNILSPGEEDRFRAYFKPTADASDLVFDFEYSADEDLNTSTQEAEILRRILDETQTVNRVIAIQGIAGVGKTGTLRGISSLPRVQEQFSHGVHLMTLGMDGTKRDLIEELSKAVERSGGRQTAKMMSTENELGKVIESFRSWFNEKKCLFAVDDVWQSKEISSSVIFELMRLHSSGDESKVILTTRSTDIASRASTLFKLEPRKTLDYESRKILFHYAGMEPKDDTDEQAVKEILERCGGLPLFLVVAGKTVRMLSLRYGHEGGAAFHVYARNLKGDVQTLLTAETDTYPRLETRLLISINLLEERKGDFAFEIVRTVAEIHRRLSVLKKQSKVPMRMLNFLWELENELQAAIVAGELEQVGLAEVVFERRGSDRVEMLRMHDSLYDFAVNETRKHREELVGHEAILRAYGDGLATKGRSGEWWHLEDDGYIHGNLCRHLLATERIAELVQLLLSPQWTEVQLQVNGSLTLESDFALAIEYLQSRTVTRSATEYSATEEELRLISEAAVLSWSFVRENFGELRFQMHGRLKRYGEIFSSIRKYVDWIETNKPTPSVLCTNSFLGEPGGTNVSILSLGVSIRCMVLMKNTEQLACGCADGGISIVNTLRNEIESTWKAHDEEVRSLAVGRNYTRLVSASLDRTIKVWVVQSGRCVTTFRGHIGAVNNVKVMKDDKRVISVSADGSAQTWEIDTGVVVSPPFTGHGKSVNCVALLEDGHHVVTGGDDNTIRLWSSTTGRQVGVPFEGHENKVLSVVITRDGRRVVSGSWDSTVRVWDIESHGQIAHSLTGHTSWIFSLAVGRDERRLISGSRDTTIRIWDMESKNEICPPLKGHGDRITGVSLLSNDDLIVSCSRDTTVRLWDLRRYNAGKVADQHERTIWSVSFTPDGKHVVSGSLDETVRIWDATSGHQVGEPLKGHSSYVNGVAITRNGRFLLSVSGDNTACVWDLQTRKILRRFTGHTHWVQSVALTPQRDRAVTGSEDGTVRVWDLRKMDGSHFVLEGHNAAVRKVYVTDDGMRVVSVDYYNQVYVWDMETREVIRRITTEDASRLSRWQVLCLAGERTVRG